MHHRVQMLTCFACQFCTSLMMLDYYPVTSNSYSVSFKDVWYKAWTVWMISLYCLFSKLAERLVSVTASSRFCSQWRRAAEKPNFPMERRVTRSFLTALGVMSSCVCNIGWTVGFCTLLTAFSTRVRCGVSRRPSLRQLFLTMINVLIASLAQEWVALFPLAFGFWSQVSWRSQLRPQLTSKICAWWAH